jgi:hypothetical protein
MVSTTDKITIPKLRGAINYEVWALRIDAFLTKENLKSALIDSDIIDEDINNNALANIKLLVEDGPLITDSAYH